MTDQTRPLTEQQLDEYEALARNATLLGADIASPNILSVLVAEVRRLRAELAGCRAQVADEVITWSGRQIGVHVPTVDAIAAVLREQPAAEGAQR